MPNKESWKQKRRRILDSLDDSMQKRVNTAQQRYGETGGKIASGVAAMTSATADFLTPEDEMDAALMVTGGVVGKALGKLRKLRKAEKASEAAFAASQAKHASKVDDYVKLGQKNKVGLAQLRQKVADDFRKGKIDAKEYAPKMTQLNEAWKIITKGN